MPMCFVIMPFGEPFNSHYRDVFAPAVESAGFSSVRSDDVRKPGAIVEQIWKGIKEADVCLAELTGCNPNVMYELGLAHAMGKTVFQVVQNIETLPFDLQHLRHIKYCTADDDWKNKLQSQIIIALRSYADENDKVGGPFPPAHIPSGEYRVYKRSFNAEQMYESINLRVNKFHLSVESIPPEWESIGALIDGIRYVGRFRYHRGSAPNDSGTHDLTWNGREFAGWAYFDNGQCDPDLLIWRPEV